MTDTDDPIVLRSRLEVAEQEVQRLTALVGNYQQSQTVPPDGENTGPVHPDPLAEVFVALDKVADRLQAVEDAQRKCPEWAQTLIDDFQRVVDLEAWKRKRDSACADCPRLKEALGGG